MNEVDFEKNKHLGEVLKLARMALNEEYLKKQQERHQEWRVACDQMWLTKGMLLPYTSSIEYPSETDIINRAVKIYNTLHPEQAPVAQITVAEPEPTHVQQVGPAEELTVTEPVEEVPVIEPTEEVPVVPVESAPTKLEDKFKSIFTLWGGKGTLPEDTK
jgi:hypothetical protein